MQARILLVFAIAVFCALSLACAGIPPRGPEPSTSIRTVAVLPLMNNTNSVDGPAMMQLMLTAGMYERYYDVLEPDEINQILKDRMGVTLGAQLDMATPQKICETLGAVDGLVYGALDDHIVKPAGVYTIKRVRARAKLVDCKTGATVWKGGAGAKSQAAVAGTVGAVAGLVGGTVSALSDVAEGELFKVYGENIEAPWFSVPPPPKQSSGNLIADVLLGALETVAAHAAQIDLAREQQAAVTAALDGYFHEVAVSGKNEKGISSGPSETD